MDLYLSRSAQESLADLQYDKCPEKNDEACAAAHRPNADKVFFHLGRALRLIPNFELPQFQARQDFEVTYSYNLVGWNAPVVMFHFADQPDAVVCSVRRALYTEFEPTEREDVDSFAFCSKRDFEPDWFCENEVPPERETYMFKIQRGRASYLGYVLRQEVYFNPGGEVTLRGGEAGTQLSPVPTADEYNQGILQARAPWDIVPAYSCKNFDRESLTGWLFQGQGLLIMHWESQQLMGSSSLVIWAMTLMLAIVQFRFLRHSGIPIGPIYMAKQPLPILFFCVVVYGNKHTQILTTFLYWNEVTEISTGLFMSLGPAMMASISSIIMASVIQMVFNPRVVVPTGLLTALSGLNWVLVFVFEYIAVPRLSKGITSWCALPTSTSCLEYEAVIYTHWMSAVISGVLAAIGCLALNVVNARWSAVEVPDTHSFLKLFLMPSFKEITTGTTGSVVMLDALGVVRVDPAILANKNLVRITDTYIVRFSMIKFVMLYEILPRPLRRAVNDTVGPMFAVVANEDYVTSNLCYVNLDQIDFSQRRFVSSYCR